MGVEGREDGVGIELVVLVVAFVLMLLRPSVDTESRDCGRRMPGMAVCDKTLGALLPPDGGESTDIEDIGRNAVGADGGLDVRRRSLSLSLAGDGESSMISTHPDESPPGVRRASASRSTLCRRNLDFAVERSSCEVERAERDEDAVEGAGEGEAFTGIGGGGIAFAAERLVTEPIRSLGTRV